MRELEINSVQLQSFTTQNHDLTAMWGEKGTMTMSLRSVLGWAPNVIPNTTQAH